LENTDPVSGQSLDHGVEVIDFEEDVVNSVALPLKKLSIGIVIAFEGLDKLEFERSELQESLPQLDVLLSAAIVIL
jgi:hypothetical protein